MNTILIFIQSSPLILGLLLVMPATMGTATKETDNALVTDRRGGHAPRALAHPTTPTDISAGSQRDMLLLVALLELCPPTRFDQN